MSDGQPDDTSMNHSGLERDPAGFLRVAPSVDRDSLYRERFYETERPDYLTKVESELDYWQAIWSLRLDRMAAATGGPGRLLDIGAGGGFFLATARALGWQGEGVEPSGSACGFARERFGIALHQGFFEEQALEEQGFDAIHLAFVLEHVHDPRAVLARAHALLRPGGVLWVEVPNDFNPLQAVIVERLGKPQWWVAPEHHLNYFDFDSLTRLLAETGFEPAAREATFPLEIFPLLGFDYIGDDILGRDLHRRRMAFEQHLLAADPQLLERLYGALAGAGLGRSCNLLGVRR